jgi:hypothetical protein
MEFCLVIRDPVCVFGYWPSRCRRSAPDHFWNGGKRFSQIRQRWKLLQPHRPDPAGPRHLTEEDLLMRSVQEARRFVPGDTVTAEVRHQSLHDQDWCWSLTRNGKVILTLDQTERYLQTTAEEHRRFSRKFDLWALLCSISLIPCALVLRRHFGGWVDKDRGSSHAHLQEPGRVEPASMSQGAFCAVP